jgi:dihydroorotate dehydrogenase
MMRALGALSRPFLLRLDPETAHRMAIDAMRLAPNFAPPAADPRLAVEAFGLKFPNPLGMAAGFDKNAEVPDALLALGFGFAEVGTLTPRPQRGNDRPRMFRLAADQALVNRLGFNNDGFTRGHARLSAREKRGIVGVNLGANKDSPDRIADYVAGVTLFSDVASYLTINISSPNTPGLRDLQQRAALDELIARVLEARDASGLQRPVLVKIAPDVDLAPLDDIVSLARARRIDGMIVSNTTISRPAGLADRAAAETGGLSGRPLFALSTRVLAQTFARVDGAFPLIGCGGVDSAEAAVAKIEAGATLLQLYTGLVWRGPYLIAAILAGLSRRLADEGARLGALAGAKAADWASDRAG